MTAPEIAMACTLAAAVLLAIGWAAGFARGYNAGYGAAVCRRPVTYTSFATTDSEDTKHELD